MVTDFHWSYRADYWCGGVDSKVYVGGKAKGGRAYDDEFKMPVFLTANNLKPFIPNDLMENSAPVIFKYKNTQYIGYRAELLPQVCGVFIDADEAGVFTWSIRGT